MTDLLTAAVVVLAAEIGDKSQLVVLTQAGTARLGRTLAGLLAVIALLQGIAASLGGTLGALLPAEAVGYGAGVLFLVFAGVTWRQVPEEDDAEPPPSSLGRLLVMFFVAEIGDRTSIAAATLAATNDPVAVWAGATAGMFAATVVALLAGRWLRARVGARRLTLFGAVAFAVAGLATIAVTALAA